MIKLHQFPPAFGLPNASPFCMKVENYLRLAEIEYETVPLYNPGKSPKGQAPFIEDGEEKIADSYFILEHLKKKYGDRLNEGLTRSDINKGHQITRVMEDHLYFAMLHIRWLQPENALITREAFFKHMPNVIKIPFFMYLQRNIKRKLHQQGIGRHSQEEIEKLAIDDLLILSEALGSEAYYGGLKPREVDCIAWAFIANIIQPPIKSIVRNAAMDLNNLVAYHSRMKNRMFPELK